MKKDLIKSIPFIQTAVLDWYAKNGRHNLPWRNLEKYNVDIPYGVLVSELMLQQTQVDRVHPKFIAFIKRFPNVSDLALASVAEVITIWSGLGYNRRAVMLHRTACDIVNHFDGKIPHNEVELLSLSGVGPYTARAVQVFGFNQDVGVVDTNIKRFYELLLFGYESPSDKEILLLDEKFVPNGRSKDWHAGIMDLMAVVRTLRVPCEQQGELLCSLSIYFPFVPRLDHKPFARPKQSQFVGSKRFYRGQIIHLLRQASRHELGYSALEKKIELPSNYTIKELLTALKKNGLIDFNESLTTNSIISLPKKYGIT
jgi:A/G-specific adenine glycosylase